MNGNRNGVGTPKSVNDEGVQDVTSEGRAKSPEDTAIIISEQKVKAPDGGWGWWIVFACLLLRTIMGGMGRSSGLFYLKFLEKFDKSATETSFVTSLSATVRLLLGPFVSVLCNRFSARQLMYLGAVIYVIAVHISGYATSVGYLYFSYGILGGIHRKTVERHFSSDQTLKRMRCLPLPRWLEDIWQFRIFLYNLFDDILMTCLVMCPDQRRFFLIRRFSIDGIGRSLVLTPCTILLGEYFDKRRSLAFGLASAGFGVGGFTVTPLIEVLFQTYGFTGTYILLSGVACNLFVCVSLLRPVQHVQNTSIVQLPNREIQDIESGEDDIMLSHISSTGSVHLSKAMVPLSKYEDSVHEIPETSEMIPTTHENSNGVDKTNSTGRRQSKLRATYEKAKNKLIGGKSNGKKKKLMSLSIFKDIRFITLCISTLVFILPTSGMFLPALAKSRGITEMQTAYLLSIVAGCDTLSRVIAGFVLDLKRLRDLRPYIYNGVSFIQSLVLFTIPFMSTFGQFSAICALHGTLQGMKAAQRSVVLVDILGVDQLANSFAILLGVQGIGTLIGPPVAGLLKDTYGKYDYTFYFGGTAVFVGAMILAGGNIRNYVVKKKQKTEHD